MADRRVWAGLLAAVMLLAGCGKKADVEPEYIPPDDESESAADSDEDSSVNDSDGDNNDDGSSDAGEEKKDEPKELYDVRPMLEAYFSGDMSGLEEFEITALDKARQVLEEIISGDMTEYEKELAVHDYLIYNCTYDPGELRAIPMPSEHCGDPYGALVDGTAICSGYSSAFRLMMGMLGIPCGTVHSVDREGDEHAWNTVQLEGDWYYVDVTWDDPVPDSDGRLVTHTFFNVSREYMEQDHVLPDEAPDTESEQYTYINMTAAEAASADDITALITAAAEAKADSVTLLTNGMQELQKGAYDLDTTKLLRSCCKSAGYVYSYTENAQTLSGDAVVLYFRQKMM